MAHHSYEMSAIMTN